MSFIHYPGKSVHGVPKEIFTSNRYLMYFENGNATVAIPPTTQDVGARDGASIEIAGGHEHVRGE